VRISLVKAKKPAAQHSQVIANMPLFILFTECFYGRLDKGFRL
jgi:hypothetical protein